MLLCVLLQRMCVWGVLLCCGLRCFVASVRLMSKPRQKTPTHNKQQLKVKEGARGQRWFLETDLRSGAALRPDKSGRALLMLLRHLGRVSEVCLVLCCLYCVRCSVASARALRGGGAVAAQTQRVRANSSH